MRAGSGLLLTTEPRPRASEHHKDLKETAARLHVAGEQQEGFGTQAREVQAQEAGTGCGRQGAAEATPGIAGNGPGDPSSNNFPEFAQPYVVIASPVGIATSTPGSTHIASGEHIALSSTEHISLTSGKRLLASASRGMRLFVQSLGYRLIAAAGDIDIRALKDSINLLAKLNITHTAERITLNAKTELVINGGGSATVYNAGGITHQTSGRYTGHAAKFSYTGPKNRAASFPEPPKPGQGNLELFNRYASSFANGAGIAGGTFEVEDALGKVFKGALDGVGHNVVSGAAPGPARVHYGKDPANTFVPASYFGGPMWPEAPQQGVAQRAQALSGSLVAAQQAMASHPVANVLGSMNQGAGNLIGTGIAMAGQLAASTPVGKALSSAAGLLGAANAKMPNGIPSAADAGGWLADAAGVHTYTGREPPRRTRSARCPRRGSVHESARARYDDANKRERRASRCLDAFA